MKIRLPQKNQSLWGLLFLSILSLFIQWYVFDFIIPTKLILPWLLYASFLFILKPYYAVGFVFLLESLFLRIHWMKMSYTNTAFEASDVFGWRQALFLKGYSDILVPVIVLAMLFCFFKGLTFKKRQLLFFPVMLLLTTSCVQERHPTEISLNPVSYLFRLVKVKYVDWNFATNIKENGVLNHLFMTLPMGQVPAKGKVTYQVGRSPKSHIGDESPDVFLILCESCYTSLSGKFVTPMSQLADHGFTRTNIISPVYGGMTAEAEFEVLTGLPSQRYKGIDFQYFAESFSTHAEGLPRVLAKAGYETFSSHNNVGYFWHRDVIHPKFGFQKSYFLEHMNWSDKENRPPDRVMYETALTAYKKNLNVGRKTFAFLITLSTHGPYKDKDDDGGEADYQEKMSKAMKDFLEFQEKVTENSQKKGRPVLFLIFGDHKPAMTISFYKRHVFNDDFFLARGKESAGFIFSDLKGRQRLTYGRVPLYIKSVGGSVKGESMAQELRDKPIYCLPGVLSENIGVYNDYYSYLENICQKESSEVLADPSSLKDLFAEEIYGNLLFE
ncbi:MAG: cation tolerance protein CutA [Bdellovibrio sp. ArHS]|uniref:LTA synthase family protein n=1 Tax=Bdellovibrio sp. ArHS TaxID=1569284 RepID=UPI000582CD78|nr:LTA synthase family protein [Bdellovibrio sp. ArHS]KHD89993.1 MAG: cation tolerance protein CutA [Bdellovibrio sp. ArHS]